MLIPIADLILMGSDQETRWQITQPQAMLNTLALQLLRAHHIRLVLVVNYTHYFPLQNIEEEHVDGDEYNLSDLLEGDVNLEFNDEYFPAKNLSFCWTWPNDPHPYMISIKLVQKLLKYGTQTDPLARDYSNIVHWHPKRLHPLEHLNIFTRKIESHDFSMLEEQLCLQIEDKFYLITVESQSFWYEIKDITLFQKSK